MIRPSQHRTAARLRFRTAALPACRLPDGAAIRPEDLPGLLAQYRIVSCDVFATAVIRRVARPADLLLAVGARLKHQGLITCEPEAFRHYRLEAEHSLRRRLADPFAQEVRLAEVYRHLAEFDIVLDPLRAAPVEVATECSACIPVPQVRRALSSLRPDQRLIFVSDTIIPSAEVAGLLRHCGYSGSFDVFTSSDASKNKFSGGLFDAVLRSLECDPSNVIHFGDDPVSDVIQPRQTGISAYFLAPQRTPPEDDATSGTGYPVRLLRSLRRAAPKLGGPKPDSIGQIAQATTILATAFASLALAEARRRHIRRIFFIARDGYLPLALARRLTADRPDEFDLSYLYASRAAIDVAIHAGKPSDLARAMCRAMPGRKLRRALGLLGIPPTEAERLVPDADAVINNGPDGFRMLEALFDREPALFRNFASDRRAAALAYLESTGFLEPGPRVIVDVGWRGSIQKDLTRLARLPPSDVVGIYLGLLPSALEPNLNPSNTVSLINGFGHPPPTYDIIRHGYGPLEMLFAAPHGTTIRYEVGSEGAAPVLAATPADRPSPQMQAAERIYQTCLAEFDSLNQLLDGAWPAEMTRNDALADIARLLLRPTRAEVAAFAAIPFIHPGDGENRETAVTHVTLAELFRSPNHALDRLNRSPWPAGAVRAMLPRPVPDITYADFQHRVKRVLGLLRL